MFHLDIKFPANYPLNPPKIRFKSKITHPYISTETGEIYLDVLGDAWNPKIVSLSKVLHIISKMLSEP